MGIRPAGGFNAAVDPAGLRAPGTHASFDVSVEFADGDETTLQVAR
jgi:hypothetical protein